MFSSALNGQRRAFPHGVSRFRAMMSLLVCVFAWSGLVLSGLQGNAATLERLTLDQMSSKATAIVCGRVVSSQAVLENNSIYTHYVVQVADRWKGADRQTEEVVLPGGVAGGLRQNFAGVPNLETGKQYVLFLWTGSSGRTQLLGLTQGLFEVAAGSTGEIMAGRGISAELMLDSNGKAVQDQAIRMPLTDLSTRVKVQSREKAVR